MVDTIKSFFGSLLGPPPQLRDRYGFRWQPNQAVPAQFAGFNIATAAGGIYVGFRPAILDTDVPTFRGNGTTPVYATPAVSAGLTTITGTILGLARPDQGLGVDNQLLGDLQGYLAYTNRCLNDLYLTAAGRALLDGLRNGAVPVFIDPAGGGGNAIQANNGNASLSAIATQMLLNPGNIDQQALSDLIVNAVPGNSLAARLTTLATQLNAMPLYSLFLQTGAYPANFLAGNLVFNGGPIDGPVLRDWIFQTDGGAFANLIAADATVVNAVHVESYFRLAMIVELRAHSAPGTGCGSAVYFNVRQDPGDPHDANTTRPPAIGLGHELVHAMHNAAGTQPGFQIQHVSTVLPELLCVGLGPFAAEPISENAIRGQWNAIRNNADQTNNIATGLRTIYEDPVVAGLTVDVLRGASRTV